MFLQVPLQPTFTVQVFGGKKNAVSSSFIVITGHYSCFIRISLHLFTKFPQGAKDHRVHDFSPCSTVRAEVRRVVRP